MKKIRMFFYVRNKDICFFALKNALLCIDSCLFDNSIIDLIDFEIIVINRRISFHQKCIENLKMMLVYKSFLRIFR